MRILRIVLVATAVSACASAQQPESVSPMPSVTLPPELDRVLRDYERAWKAHDAQALSSLFAEDGFVLANGRPPVRGRAAIREAYSTAGGALALRAIAYLTNDKLGYIVGAFGPAAGSPDSGKFVLTLKRDGQGPWLIMSDMDNPNQIRPSQPRPTATATAP